VDGLALSNELLDEVGLLRGGSGQDRGRESSDEEKSRLEPHFDEGNA